MKYDWDRYGNPGAARFTRAMTWVLAAMAAVGWLLFLLAGRGDWTLVVVPLLATAGAVVNPLALRKHYGVREVHPAERMRREVRATGDVVKALAEEVELLRQQKWDRIADLAYRSRPPDPARLAPVKLIPVEAKVSGMQPFVMPDAGFSSTMAEFGARINAAFGGCPHKNAEPVDLLLTGERVGWVCPDCPAELPANWR